MEPNKSNIMEFSTIIAVAGAVVMGARLVLLAIAPLTKNTVDDKAVEFLTKSLEVLSLHVKK